MSLTAWKRNLKENVESTLINCALEMFHFLAMVNIFYVKLQNAFVSEKGDSVGNWYLIGYNGPGDWSVNASTKTSESGASTKSTNFTYTDNLAPTTIPASATKALSISNLAKLNDCAIGENWTLSLGAGSAAGEVSYTPAIVGAGCDPLTPSFKQIK